MQEMDSEFKDETTKRQSSVVSSEASSQISVSSGYDYETQSSVLKKKSSSLSCLPDRISDFDHNTFTLPPNLSTVKPFEENLLPKGASSARSWYETAECLEEQHSEEELSSNDDQRSAFDLNSSEDGNNTATNGMTNGADPQVKREVDLSEINTVTHTFVRSSALDILAQFPRTETISTMEGSDQHTTLNVVQEDAQEGCSKSIDQLSGGSQAEQNEVSSWSSTSDIKKKHKKKGLFNNKKVKDLTHLSGSKSTEQLGNQDNAKKEKKKIRKEKAKSAQSSGWLNVLRGKSTVTEERSNNTKSKKQRKPVQKSQSFNSDSLPRSSQLNRMDSFRKLFKRPRDPAALSETKPIDNVKCVEISSPILKSDFRSKNLVDREVFLRERAYQMDKTKIKRVENESGVGVCNVKANNNDTSVNNDKRDTNERKTESVVGNGYVKSQERPESQESPIAPVRHKHLQKKQRLSLQDVEGFLQDDLSQDNDNNKNFEQDQENNRDREHVKSDSKKDEEVQTREANDNDSTSECSNETKHNDQEQPNHDACSANEENNNLDKSIAQSGRTCDIVNLDHSQVAESAINDELQTVEHYVIVESVPNDSSVPVTPDTSPTQIGKQACTPQSPEWGSHVTPDVSPAQVRNHASTPQTPDSEFEEVFVDCINDEKISLDSATLLVDKPQVASDETDGASMPAGGWNSDVTSRASQRAITKVIQKKPASFPGVKTSSGESTKGTNMATSPIIGARSLTAQPRRSSSTFRLPSVRFEATEPISLITDMVPVTFPNFLTDRRSQIVLELFTTERTYVRGLETMIELFQKPMLAGRMDERDVDAMFSNLNEIFAVNKDLLFLLWEKVKHWSNEQCIAQMFIDMEERFKIYATYCKNFDRADSMLKQKIKKNKEFERFLKACYQDPLCQPGLDLPAYLITIVQRIPRYLLLLKDLYKKTPSSHPDYHTLQTALTRMNKVAEYINSQLQEVHGKKAMQELRSTVIGLKAYEVKGRTLLKEAEVCLMNPKRPYKCLLFNDIMVFAVQGPKDRSEIEMTLELRTLWFEDLKKQDPQTTKCDAIELYTPHRPYTMYACSRRDKRIWIQKLRTAIVTLLYGPDCEDPDGMDISRRKASDTYFDGSVYCGEYVNGKRHGQGVMAWPNRTRYEGSWADDERHGHGQLTYYTGEKYVGNWVADKKEGEGQQTYVNNDVFHGQWREGKMHGKGVIDFANGDRYDGEMSNNEVEGNGEMTCTSGLVYKGEWKKSKRHGQGHLFLPNGNEYKGEMLNDRICGSGQMIYFNGDEYTGEWVNELRHGRGFFKLVNGTVYDGQWNNDFMNGQGKMAYPNGDEYTGTWHKNKRVGKGQLMYAHGDTYNGQWEADTMHGKGVMYYKDGSVYEGEWENGKPSGHGKTIFKDRRIYEGEYYLGFRHGRGQLIYPNNVLYVGEWKWDKFDGNGVFNDPNTDYSYSGDWSCGMREGSGIEISYRERYEGSWKADMKHGSGVEKSHAGHVFKGTWKENRKHGEGVRTLIRSKVEENQHWHEGHLMDGGQTVAEGLPPLPRR